MLAPGLQALRLSLHVLAATIWVGGQFTLAGLVPAARALGTQAPAALARAFARLSWPAFAVLVITGFWNIGAIHPSQQSTAWQVVLWVKIGVVALSGLGAFAHTRATSKSAIAAFGALSALSATAALVMGVLLAGPGI